MNKETLSIRSIDLHLEHGLDLALEGCDALVLQDYEKGFFNPERIARFIQKGRERGIPICVDPKHLHFWEFKGVDLFKPNLKELEQALQRKIRTETSELEEACAEARERLVLSFVAGDHGGPGSLLDG